MNLGLGSVILVLMHDPLRMPSPTQIGVTERFLGGLT